MNSDELSFPCAFYSVVFLENGDFKFILLPIERCIWICHENFTLLKFTMVVIFFWEVNEGLWRRIYEEKGEENVCRTWLLRFFQRHLLGGSTRELTPLYARNYHCKVTSHEINYLGENMPCLVSWWTFSMEGGQMLNGAQDTIKLEKRGKEACRKL